MKFSIIPLYLGKRTNIYTIHVENDELSEYKKFVIENYEKVPNAVRNLDTQLKYISSKSGIIDEQFKRESPPKYNVFRIEETEDYLRLYCIKYSHVAIVIGGGGLKDSAKRKLKDNPELKRVVDFLMSIEDAIFEAIKSKEIKLTDNGFEGNINLEVE